MEVVITRPFGVYGAGQTGRLIPNMIRSIAEGKEIELQKNPVTPADVDGLKISLCHIEDAVAIYRMLISKGGPPCLNVAGEAPFSIREIAATIGRLLGVDVRYKVADTARDTDLIADTTRLTSYCSISFKSLEYGLQDCLTRLPT
jgi:nucleoside-diphosphate-sugar epimerase